MPTSSSSLRPAGTLLALGALFYSAWLLAPTLGLNVPAATGYVSELSAGGQPFAWLFRSTDVVSGALFLAAALLGWRDRAPHYGDWVGRCGWGAVALMGVATILDAAFAMSCAPSLDAQCRAAEDAGTLPVVDLIHLVTSGTAGVGLALTAALAWAPEITQARRTARGLAVVLVACCAWASATALVDEGSSLEADPGLAQRVQLLVALVYLLVLAHGLWKRRSP